MDEKTEARYLLDFEHEWRAGDRQRAREIAAEYVGLRNDELFDQLGSLTREELVHLVDGYRAQGDNATLLVLQMWQLTKFEKAHIRGVARLNPLLPRDVVAAAEALLARKPLDE